MRLVLLAVLLVPAGAAGQPPRTSNVEALVASVETGAPAYDYGEIIEVRFTLANPTDSLATLVGSSSCQAQFELDGLRSGEHTICTLDEIEIPIRPHASRTWVWRLDPREIGLPSQSSTHTLVGEFYPKRDTTTFEAPAYLGGVVYFSTVPGVRSADLQALRDSLHAEVLEEYESLNPQAGINGRWRISGVQVDSAAALYSADSRFRAMEVVRWIQYADIVVTAGEPEPAAVRAGRAYPNPASTVVTLDLGADGGTAVKVFDRLGRRVLEARAAGRLDVSGLPAGVYVACVAGRPAVRFTVAR